MLNIYWDVVLDWQTCCVGVAEVLCWGGRSVVLCWGVRCVVLGWQTCCVGVADIGFQCIKIQSR